MLSLTRKAEYAIIGLAHLALSGRRCSAREISASRGLPFPVLVTVLKALSRHGLLRGLRGVYGGYELAAPPSEIALSDIIAAVGGGDHARLVPCAAAGECPMGRSDTCSVRGGLDEANRRMREILDGTSLADIVAGRSA